jgi:hypothetical protein
MFCHLFAACLSPIYQFTNSCFIVHQLGVHTLHTLPDGGVMGEREAMGRGGGGVSGKGGGYSPWLLLYAFYT